MSKKFSEIFDDKNFTLNLTGKFTIPELAEMVDFLKDEKAKSIETEFKVGERVYVDGYRDYYGIGEILEIEISIWDSGEPSIICVVDGIGNRYESELRKAE